ncbi:MAG: endopeptidase La [Mariprofundales bacterium]|nr:endopeptidase La [Mariprofundales bacterium]
MAKLSAMEELPVLPLRDVVVYPHMVLPLFIGREKSARALELAMTGGKRILLLAQRQSEQEDPAVEDLFEVGTLGEVLQLLRLPDGTIKVLVEGRARVAVHGLREANGMMLANWHTMPLPVEEDSTVAEVANSVLRRFEEYAKRDPRIPAEVMISLGALEQMDRLADTIVTHLNPRLEARQHLLEVAGVIPRLEYIYGLLDEQMDILDVDQRIRSRVKQQMERRQREYYLSEQMQAIKKELDHGDGEGEIGEVERLKKQIADSGMSQEAQEKSTGELSRLEMMPAMSAEATVVRTYLEWMLALPWKKRSRVNRDLKAAEAVLDHDHFGLDKVKERILEQLAVLQLIKRPKGSILCFVGPPGVGKTSLGRSIARATKREFARVSLGGVRDEAEIRGHRRTYIGSLPGKVIQAMKKVGTRNPVILLDEVDKLGADFRGDPASALLEVLDPEQNHTFGDHFLEVDFDLSEVLFITTANSLNIPTALRDRMEIIRISGYTEQEKLEIAQRHLLERQRKGHGLKKGTCTISSEALIDVIRYYTSEAGVRELNRVIAKLFRRSARKLVQSGFAEPITITPALLEEYLGVRKYRHGLAEATDQIGVVTGLAWTEVGGELLQIETALTQGKGKLTVTGQIGDVMQESVQAALTYVRSRASQLGLRPDFHQKVDIHVHVPEGAIPKDGPSAGLAMATSMVSALTGIPIRRDLCMTGEINLRGKALPIGGLKEKLLAALRGGLRVALVPELNANELKEVPESIRDGLEIHLITEMDAVLRRALVRMPASFDLPLPSVAALLADLQAEPVAIEARTTH